MANRNITSADVAATLVVEELFPQGFMLEMFGADAAIMNEAADELETHMTVDGKLVAGYTPAPKTIKLTFEAASPTLEYFRTWRQAQQSNLKPYACRLNVRQRATGKEYSFLNGFMVSCPAMPSVGKVLEAVEISLTFESVE